MLSVSTVAEQVGDVDVKGASSFVDARRCGADVRSLVVQPVAIVEDPPASLVSTAGCRHPHSGTNGDLTVEAWPASAMLDDQVWTQLVCEAE